MKRTGILGGSFDPIHYGHLSIAEAAADELELDRVILMPARVSPFKLGRKMAEEADRVAMLKLVAAGNDKYAVSTLEVENNGVSYTYDTLQALKKLYPEDELWFLMGTDAFLSLETWYKGPELLREFSFAAAPRPGFDIKVLDEKADYYTEKFKARIRILHNKMLYISSTDIKSAIRDGLPIGNFVPEAVERYINEHGLYK